MKFPGLDHYMTGVAVPVSALRSEKSIGIGEFADLPLLSRWCRSVGLEVIQILPVNDTGGDSSPYSAVSAFALHPVYTRIGDLPELDQLGSDRARLEKMIEMLRVECEAQKTVRYRHVTEEKTRILREIFRLMGDKTTRSREFSVWVEKNPWVIAYSVFKNLKDVHGQKPWTEWDRHRDPDPAEIAQLWSSGTDREDFLFYAWVQYRLEAQLTAAARALEKDGVYLKGDLPILMNQDSADVWADRRFFRTDYSAGAPPDMFSELGQNWGFPVYDWDTLAAEDYVWWKNRLRQASKFYHAYRIDHVLGFFRIWAVQTKNVSGTMGAFYPSDTITHDDLYAIGFDDGRIVWLSEPHMSGDFLRSRLEASFPACRDACFVQLPGEDLYRFSSDIGGERDIIGLGLEPNETEIILDAFRDRALIRLDDETFAPAWKYADCTRFGQLEEDERYRLEGLIAYKAAESEKKWEKMGRRLLGFMKKSSDMLTCAEDLGVIPPSVPTTLESLGILGLRVPRWARRYNTPGEPFIPVTEYAFLTVCAPSVHDTSTLREWWQTDPAREEFSLAQGVVGKTTATYGPATAQAVMAALMKARSVLVITQIQDFFALDGKLTSDDPAAERINVPGTYNETNWVYRIPATLEDLEKRDNLNKQISDLTKTRALRELE